MLKFIKAFFDKRKKNTRIKNNLSKSHRIDALCIAQHPSVKLCNTYFLQKKVRCHNRQIHKRTILRGGKRKRNSKRLRERNVFSIKYLR